MIIQYNTPNPVAYHQGSVIKNLSAKRTYVRKKDKNQVNMLTTFLKELEKEKQK